MRRSALLLLAAGLAAACSNGPSDGAVAANPTASDTAGTTGESSLPPQSGPQPTPTEVPASDLGTVFTPRPDIVDAHVGEFESWSRPDGGADAVDIHFYTGTPECSGAYTTTEETDSEVRVTLHTGTLPEAQDKACILVAVFATLTVPLEQPLGDRSVVSGA
ncbi:hypothetical protein DW322_08100 [Rhodococcus rhodnii]|uniref:Lipoprotein n=2 Tax=Rhodococcus rhodnii TaxID=38312 RepID=R7WQP9_9NOCA|nr:hypothetical protein [Rhodococcus rhodnii]EOM77646.1 hypothetical protein Rrhod_1057 [Rhodococcus rhodnii LMG 5362]TXG90191.1 hypothetical protein DW322_08100 [Rhodococcus rhodnii]